MSPLFLDILSAHLPMLPPGTPVLAETELSDLGLDSLHTVSLLLDLEDALDISLPDSVLADPETFRNARNLWSVVSDAQAALAV